MSDTPRTDAKLLTTGLMHSTDALNSIYDFARQLERDLAAANARAEQNEKDAARHRFLRDDDNWIDDGPVTWEILGELSHKDFDSAIDAAIAAKEKPNG